MESATLLPEEEFIREGGRGHERAREKRVLRERREARMEWSSCSWARTAIGAPWLSDVEGSVPFNVGVCFEGDLMVSPSLGSSSEVPSSSLRPLGTNTPIASPRDPSLLPSDSASPTVSPVGSRLRRLIVMSTLVCRL